MKIKNGLPAIHPGEFLKEMLEDIGTSQAEFARAIGVSSMRVSHVVNGTRPVTAELALLFGRVFGQSPQYWQNLQASFDLKTAERVMKDRMREGKEGLDRRKSDVWRTTRALPSNAHSNLLPQDRSANKSDFRTLVFQAVVQSL